MATIVVPARLHSSRLPQKLIQKLDGRELILHLCERLLELGSLHEIIISTDSAYMHNLIRSRTALNSIICDLAFQNGTERCAWTVRAKDYSDVIVNVQGDEMMCNIDDIVALIKVMEGNKSYDIGTLIAPLHPIDRPVASIVKAVINDQNIALDFVRTTHEVVLELYSHIGIYAYRNTVLQSIAHLPTSAREQSRSLEQMRWLDAGYKIHCIGVPQHGLSVNTLNDLRFLRHVNRYKII